MKAKAYCAHPSIRDDWALSCMSRCPDQEAPVPVKYGQICRPHVREAMAISSVVSLLPRSTGNILPRSRKLEILGRATYDSYWVMFRY
ncbi:hypothetical protein TNCV_665271 [Trichonephila clavipes]|uniref:Uncharacterized protein n=1 Tax=Trichonephila clavipes TaxID=2585209 RepID=A0A8X6SIS1_TRICX|nr:hypothetical protein TNCV_665271 [Trichonephila clavipes]